MKDLIENVPIFSRDDIKFNKETIYEIFKNWDVPSASQIKCILILEEEKKIDSVVNTSIILIEAYEDTLNKTFSSNTIVIEKIEEYLENILEAKFDVDKFYAITNNHNN